MTTLDRRLVPEGPLALWLASAIGRRQLQAMKQHGLPLCLHRPIEFLNERTLTAGDSCPIDRIEQMRSALARRPGVLGVFVDPASTPASSRRADEARPPVRSMTDAATVSSVPAVWGTFLHLAASARRATTILELGSGAGISGCYLASVPTCRRFVTVEGNADRADLARTHLAAIAPHAEVVTSSFGEALDRLLPTLTDGLDFAFIDGDKRKGTYVRLVDRLAPHLNDGALVVFDDIQWSDVHGDLETLGRRPGLSHLLFLGRFGVAARDARSTQPHVSGLYDVLGVDIYKLRRDVARWLPIR